MVDNSRLQRSEAANLIRGAVGVVANKGVYENYVQPAARNAKRAVVQGYRYVTGKPQEMHHNVPAVVLPNQEGLNLELDHNNKALAKRKAYGDLAATVSEKLALYVDPTRGRPEIEAESIDVAMERLTSISLFTEGSSYSIIDFGQYNHFGHPDLINEAITSDLHALSQSLVDGEGIDLTSPVLKNENIFKAITGIALSATSDLPENFDLVESQDFAKGILTRVMTHAEKAAPDYAKNLVNTFIQDFTSGQRDASHKASAKRTLAIANLISQIPFDIKTGNYNDQINDFAQKIKEDYEFPVGDVVARIVQQEAISFLAAPLSSEYLGNKDLDYEDDDNAITQQALNTLAGLWTSTIPEKYMQDGSLGDRLVGCFQAVITNAHNADNRQEAVNEIHKIIDEDIKKVAELKSKVKQIKSLHKKYQNSIAEGVKVAIPVDDASEEQLKSFLEDLGYDSVQIESICVAHQGSGLSQLRMFTKETVGSKYVIAKATNADLKKIKEDWLKAENTLKDKVKDSTKVRLAIGHANASVPGLGIDLMKLIAFQDDQSLDGIDDYADYFNKNEKFYEESVRSLAEGHAKKLEIQKDKDQAQVLVLEKKVERYTDKLTAQLGDSLNLINNIKDEEGNSYVTKGLLEKLAMQGLIPKSKIDAILENLTSNDATTRAKELGELLYQLANSNKNIDPVQAIKENIAYVVFKNEVINHDLDYKLRTSRTFRADYNEISEMLQQGNYKSAMIRITTVLNASANQPDRSVVDAITSYTNDHKYIGRRVPEELKFDGLNSLSTDCFSTKKDIKKYHKEYRSAIKNDAVRLDQLNKSIKLADEKITKIRDAINGAEIDYDALQNVCGDNVLRNCVNQMKKNGIVARERFFRQVTKGLPDSEGLMVQLREAFVKIVAAILEPFMDILESYDDKPVETAAIEIAKEFDTANALALVQA